jgi:hypothetical protein
MPWANSGCFAQLTANYGDTLPTVTCLQRCESRDRRLRA